MTKTEKEFLSDIEDAVEDYDYDIEYYHEDSFNGRYFTVMVSFDEDEWCDDEDNDIWNSLEEVANDWDAGIDDEGSCCIGLSLNVD